MFGKQIILKDDSFKVGGKDILWGDITGIREFDSTILRQFFYRKAFPRMELFLKNGKVISAEVSRFFRVTRRLRENLYQ